MLATLPDPAERMRRCIGAAAEMVATNVAIAYSHMAEAVGCATDPTDLAQLQRVMHNVRNGCYTGAADMLAAVPGHLRPRTA